MIKRILLSLMSIIAIYSFAAVMYRVYEPTNLLNNSTNSSYISYSTLQEYTLSNTTATKHYYFFYSSIDSNSTYVMDTLLKVINRDTDIDIESVIEVVDVTPLDENNTLNRITTEWGIREIPAFLCISVANNTITIDSTLEWTDESPLTAELLESWFQETGLIS